MKNRHFKSGMGTDVDPIRMVLLLVPLILAFVGYDHHNLALLLVAILLASLFGWWVTRAWYLDVIEGLKEEISQLEKS